MNNATKTLPETFQFTTDYSNYTYTATKDNGESTFTITWQMPVGNKFHLGTLASAHYDAVLENISTGLWKLVEPKKVLPSTFKFKHVDDEDLIYTATKQPEGDYKITWRSRGLPREIPWLTGELENNIRDGIWNIVEEPILNCENYDEGNTANIPPTSAASIYDPISFLMGAMNESDAEEYCECCEDISLLDAIKDFTEHTGADVIITEGSYVVIYKGEEYNACCEEQLTDIMDAVTTLDMANF